MKLPVDLGSTSAPALHPDEGPGAGMARDDALDAAAREGMRVEEPYPAAGSISAAQAADDMRAALEAGRLEYQRGPDGQVMLYEREVRARMVTVPSMPAARNCGGTPGAPQLVPLLYAGRQDVAGFAECLGCADCETSER